MKYINTDANRRVWPNLQNPDGSTLELEAGEEVEIKGKRIKDTILKPTKLSKKEQEEVTKEEEAAADTDADTDPVEEQK